MRCLPAIHVPNQERSARGCACHAMKHAPAKFGTCSAKLRGEEWLVGGVEVRTAAIVSSLEHSCSSPLERPRAFLVRPEGSLTKNRRIYGVKMTKPPRGRGMVTAQASDPAQAASQARTLRSGPRLESFSEVSANFTDPSPSEVRWISAVLSCQHKKYLSFKRVTVQIPEQSIFLRDACVWLLHASRFSVNVEHCCTWSIRKWPEVR